MSARSTEHSQEEPEIRFESETNMYIQSEWILLITRVILAAVMIFYGWPKIRDLASNANDFEKMGFKPGIFWGTLIAIVEFAGGIAILLGFYAELAAALFGFQMMVGTFWKLKVKKPFSDYSYDMQLFALCLVVMSQGAGAYALKAFPGAIFLRWDVAVASLALAGIFALFCKPAVKHEERVNNKAFTEALGAKSVLDDRQWPANQKMEGVRGSTQKASEGAATTVSERYKRNLRMIGDLQTRATTVQGEALEETRADVGKIMHRLERLAERAKRELRDLKIGLDWTILETEIGLRLTVDDAKAHLKLIEAKRELIFARRAAQRKDLVEARARVEAGLKLIDEAQSLALGQHDNLVALQRQTQAKLAMMDKEAAKTAAAIDAVLERSDRILEHMNESEAATKNAA